MNENSKRIAKNTMYLYLRMIVLMLISLYTSRVTLSALGVEDYGIYNVVGGVVTMFSMISGSLTTAISRYLTFELGKFNPSNLKRIFATAINIQIGIAVLIIILAETVGLWFLNYKMVIPADRLHAANWVYQISLFTFCINLMNVPFNAAIIAHEKMSAFAYISIFDAIGKLSTAYIILVVSFDKLIVFSSLIAFFAFVIVCIYVIYCYVKFSEARYQFCIDNDLIIEMFGFAGWNFLGSSAMILREHGGSLVINLFAGPAVNASRAIATKVNTVVQGFINNFTMALNPQITKSYAASNYEYMSKLIFKGARLSYYMMLLISLPVIFNADFLLQLWLKDVPLHTVLFVQLTLILAMSDIMSGPLITSILATGKVRNYQIIVGTFQLFNIPVSYILLKYGMIPEFVVMVSIVFSHITLFLRLIMLSRSMPFKPSLYIKEVYFKVLQVTLVSITPIILLSNLINVESWGKLFLLSFVSLVSSSLSIWIFGMEYTEKEMVMNKLNNFIKQKGGIG